jgi:hypothetical protein
MHTLEFRLEPSMIAGLPESELRAALRDFQFHPGYPQLQPDLAIGTRTTAFSGTGVIDPTGQSQAVSAPTIATSPATFRVRWRNRAPELADGARFSGPAGDPLHRVNYFATGNGRVNITAFVALGLWETRFVNPGSGSDREISVRRTSKKRPRTGFSGVLRASSLLRETRRDSVGFRTVPR